MLPEHMANGSYDRESAIRLQIQADIAIVAETTARTSAAKER